MDRREFLLAGVAGGATVLTPGKKPSRRISLVADPTDPVVSASAAEQAIAELQLALGEAGLTVLRRERPEQAESGEVCIVASGTTSAVAMAALRDAGIAPPKASESLVLISTRVAGCAAVLACGTDPRGLSYALLELADRVRHGTSEMALQIGRPVVEKPANSVRSVMRQFTSELLDKPWFYDREMWPHYFTLLATHRFNRFHLAFGLGYDSLNRVEDSYFLFLYPFLLSVPGYDVRATNLLASERDRNLETLRFISEQCVARGLDFQLGVWMHGYRWPANPRARNMIEGLTDQTHASYCRDALTAVLRACPSISSVALRIHGESGIAEGSYDFWKTIFDGVRRCGRQVEIDLHAKGIDDTMIRNALATGMPVNVAPKFSAEHLGLPYHQAAIRDLEMPVTGHTGAGLMTLSEGARVFTRYGYADLLREDRRYTVRHRVFSGTQRLLLWGDPVFAAAYSRSFQFCGSTGADLMEPLTCRGRRGTAGPGRRTGYADLRLEPRWDWEKYEPWYRVWGRYLYNPNSDPQASQRALGSDPQAAHLLSALAQASRILPIVTAAHLPSAACDAYWPEIYWNQPLAAEARNNPYTDTPSPKTFLNASPLDPQLFSGVAEHAVETLQRNRSGRYSPIEVAQWLEDCARRASRDLAQVGSPESAERRRAAIDISLQVGLGRFFAAKFRSGVLYAIHEHTGSRLALEKAVRMYRKARFAWAEVADRAKGVYLADLSASDKFSERGQWADRLPDIDEDIARMGQRLAAISEKPRTPETARVVAAIAQALSRPLRPEPACRHTPPRGFRPRDAIRLELALPDGPKPISALLHYRHVNQSETFLGAEMEATGGRYRGQIPAAYTDSPYPLQYYFELRESPEKAWFYPGLGPDLVVQPYFVLRWA